MSETETGGGGRLTHLDESGAARMVDVSSKAVTAREAVAEGRVVMTEATRAAIMAGNVPKGDVLAAARIAGIMAAKKTAELIPLCHPVALTAVEVALEPVENGLKITARASTCERTGVEMEALTAVQAAALTVYDMAKALERGMRITDVRLISKSGGRSGDWRAEGA